ncbi:rod shape-determining protein MreC [Simiduia sp. 21SJ11W-1]|uniref:rod shape-determining protein MreC n=1 Tax=Simiduia sp. 21SJ11W-1 TaxID=2909669 RepID=UPI0020A22A63|nr:rod shape-determining protein MreC [Simiduia sp. 21SJ11W-1]UTA49627.1 rod shape-determining protein MreC [Simiduia sp. 21SJ11W-1]
MLALLLINRFTPWLDPVREQVGQLAVPFYWLTNVPTRLGEWLDDSTRSRAEVESENAALKGEILVLKRKLQQMASLAAENVRLRQLLNSADLLEDRVLVAELIGVSPDPQSHIVVVNKGRDDGVYIGQPLLDAHGLMGQVIDLTPISSRVMLITDPTHALPVQVNRNGVRAIAEGIGDLYALKLRHVSSTVDIRVGDVLVSSGLGQRFPVGYPVAEVMSVSMSPGKPFADVIAKPRAQLNRSRHVLLVFDNEASHAGAESQ